MERLTKWEDDSITYNEKRELECGEYCDSCSQGAGNCKTVENMIKKLATYEDLEEQGLLVRLPCKVGDTVYVPTRVLVSEFKITAIFCDIHGTYFYWLFYCGIYERTSGFSERDIGKTVFLTREEAEKELEEMKNGL
jgi:hypothetical protein